MLTYARSFVGCRFCHSLPASALCRQSCTGADDKACMSVARKCSRYGEGQQQYSRAPFRRWPPGRPAGATEGGPCAWRHPGRGCSTPPPAPTAKRPQDWGHSPSSWNPCLGSLIILIWIWICLGLPDFCFERINLWPRLHMKTGTLYCNIDHVVFWHALSESKNKTDPEERYSSC